MSTYVRSPRKKLVYCPMADCAWKRLYFDKMVPTGLLPAEMRANRGLHGHLGRMHSRRRRVTLINGR